MSKYLSRRKFIAGAMVGGAGLALPFSGWGSPLMGDAGAVDAVKGGNLYSLCTDLTATWAQKLLGLQVTDASRTAEYGGILCPTRKIVHGRVGDTIYPFLHMAKRTGDHRYVDASVLLYRWMEAHVSQPDGSWLNEPEKGSWKGTTVFAVIALCEALRYHGELLEPSLRKEMEVRLLKAGDFIYDNFNVDYGNINYPLSATYALSLLGTMQDVARYREKGRELAHQGLKFFTKKNGFVFGEGTPYYQASPKGCFSVDLGYSVEESLPSLAEYGLLTKDEEVLGTVVRSMQTYMEFMLPDGAWDNSWGTRNYKWTWWGSRTSDGCQPAYALLADRDRRFYKAAYANTLLLQQTTHEGLLYGGPHYVSHGEPVDVHHTFCHIKALVTVLDHDKTSERSDRGGHGAELASGVAVGSGYGMGKVILPREERYGSKFFEDVQTWLISVGGYRATVTGYDREYKNLYNGHATGGALSLLWHEDAGPLLVASMNAYQLVEAGNMQADNDLNSMPLTPRIQLIRDGELFMNISDLAAVVTVMDVEDGFVVEAKGKLVNKKQQDPADGPVTYTTRYLFKPDVVELFFDYTGVMDARIFVPLISATEEAIKVRKDGFHIKKKKGAVVLSADKPLHRLRLMGEERLFNFVPGMEAIPFEAEKGSTVRIEVVK